jgi:8-oxo-dGTP pyrophosphatase MutT (NUDIX family)
LENSSTLGVPDGEVPPEIWQADSFQRWHQAQRGAGNSLEGVEVLWSRRSDSSPDAPVFWAVRVAVRIAAEGRVKSNEIVISRPDSSSVALYRPAPVPVPGAATTAATTAALDDTVVVLVREFRSPASTADGFVHELPGGSGDSGDPRAQAVTELQEETGLKIDADRLRAHGSRQVAATLSAHHTHLFSAPITDAELARLRELQQSPHGDGPTERTWIEITTFGEIRRSSLVDWSTLGMLAQALLDD